MVKSPSSPIWSHNCNHQFQVIISPLSPLHRSWKPALGKQNEVGFLILPCSPLSCEARRRDEEVAEGTVLTWWCSRDLGSLFFGLQGWFFSKGFGGRSSETFSLGYMACLSSSRPFIIPLSPASGPLTVHSSPHVSCHHSQQYSMVAWSAVNKHPVWWPSPNKTEETRMSWQINFPSGPPSDELFYTVFLQSMEQWPTWFITLNLPLVLLCLTSFPHSHCTVEGGGPS